MMNFKASLRLNGLAYIVMYRLMYRQYKGPFFFKSEMSKSENTSEY